jgi:hypothetical protein
MFLPDKTAIDVVKENDKAKAIELIRSIQSGKAGYGELKELERVTGIPNAWGIFDAYELEGMLPGKIFEMFFCNNESATA